MQKALLLFPSLFFLLVNSAFADLTVSISDFEKKKMRVTYTYIANIAGKKALDFPEHAFEFAKGPIDVISAREINSNKDLEYHIFKSTVSTGTGRYRESIRIVYPSPVPEGKEFNIEVIVEATTDNIYCETEGRYTVTYETDHQFYFILPEGYAIVYSNIPVLVEERDKSVIIQVKKMSEDGERRKLIFKIQAFSEGVVEEPEEMVFTEDSMLESKIPSPLSHDMSESNTDSEEPSSGNEPLSYPYSLKLGSYRTLEKAQKAITLYSNKNFCPYWVKVDLRDKGKWYRIFTGHFENYEQAKRFKEEQGLTESVVRKTPYAGLIGNYISPDELEKQSLLLKDNGYSPYIIEDPKGIFRLFVGAFSTMDEAAEQCDDMKSHSIECHIVKR